MFHELHERSRISSGVGGLGMTRLYECIHISPGSTFGFCAPADSFAATSWSSRQVDVPASDSLRFFCARMRLYSH